VHGLHVAPSLQCSWIIAVVLRKFLPHLGVCTHTQGDVHIGTALGLAIAMGYLYQGPPFR
jgi:1,4-dihydroxy-2-naphthoate octaprenyltransferase